MANIFFTKARQEIVLQNLNLSGEAALKVMLVDDLYAPPVSASFVFDGTSGCAAVREITGATGYTGGFNGADRTVPANRTFARQDGVLNRIEFHFDNITWLALGATANIGGAVMIVEKTSDSDSWLVAFWDTNNITTNGSDIILQVDATGALYF